METPELNVYAYLDIAAFLKDFYLYKKRGSSVFSYRLFAKKAGVPAGLFQDVIAGRRNLSEAAALKFATAMKFSQRETEYLLWLIRFDKAKNPDLKNEAFNEICKFRSQARMRFMDQEYYEFYSHWYNAAVRLLITLPNFIESPEWIAAQLQPKITKSEARRALELLEKLGLTERDARGALKMRDPLLSTDYELNSLAVRNYNKQMITLALEALDTIPRPQREISGLDCSVSKQGFQRIKDRIHRFKEDVLNIALEDKADPEVIYQLNLQLFPLSKVES
jgi:uncharacterized protein (TIGR02147 family)